MANGGPVCGPISSYSRVQILHLLFEAGSSQTRGELSITELCEATGCTPTRSASTWGA